MADLLGANAVDGIGGIDTRRGPGAECLSVRVSADQGDLHLILCVAIELVAELCIPSELVEKSEPRRRQAATMAPRRRGRRRGDAVCRRRSFLFGGSVETHDESTQFVEWDLFLAIRQCRPEVTREAVRLSHGERR